MFSDLRHYSRVEFLGDLSAGIVTGIVAIPLSLGLAIATGVPPVWGLYTAMVAGFVAAFFAGSRYSVSGPAAAMIPILSPIIAQYGLDRLPVIGLLAGIFLVVFGLLRLGNLIRYIPPAVTYGFTAGIAVVIAAGQLNNFFGLTGVPAAPHFHEKLLLSIEHLPGLSLPTLAIGVLALAILIGMPYLPGSLKKIPPSLIAVVACTAITLLVPQFAVVPTIADAFGAIALGLPPLTLDLPFGDAFSLIIPALKVAALVSIESLLCAVVADKMTRTRHRPNQELIAQGIANLFTPFLSGIPATAVIARTGTSIKNGAKTRIASIIHAAVVLVFLVVLAPLGSQIPLTVLAAVLFVTAWKISETKEIMHLIRLAPRADLGVLGITFLLTVFLDLTVSVGFGLILSALLIFRRLATVHAEEVTATGSSFVNETVRRALAEHAEVQFVNLEGNLSMGFGNSLVGAFPIHAKTRRLILRLRGIQHVDLSGLEALAELVQHAQSRGIQIHFAGVNHVILPDLEKFGLISAIDGLHESTTDAIRELYPDRERRRGDAPVAVDRRAR